jgi:hypothetical protein
MDVHAVGGLVRRGDPEVVVRAPRPRGVLARPGRDVLGEIDEPGDGAVGRAVEHERVELAEEP